MTVRVKICGCTSKRDLAVAIEAGADAVGFLVGLDYESEDEITAGRAAELAGTLPPFVTPVLVTHETDRKRVADLCRQAGVQHVQLHGHFSLDDIGGLRADLPYLRIIKAAHVETEESVGAALRACRAAHAVILDTRTEERLGGTGEVHDWSISRSIRDRAHPVPVILAGGLTAENVEAAITTVRPYAVDVNSGVSRPRGIKSGELVTRFVARAKGTV